jgi:hypothetical protein
LILYNNHIIVCGKREEPIVVPTTIERVCIYYYSKSFVPFKSPIKITISMDLVTSFRIVDAFTIGIFWGLMGITLGSFWDKLKPNETSKITSA